MRYRTLALAGLAVVCIGALFVSVAPFARAQVGTYPSWTCSVDGGADSLTQCQQAPDPSIRLYVSNIVAQSATATGGLWILKYGTGTNCGTGTASLFPSAATAARIAAPANTAPPSIITFSPALALPAGKALCLLGVATNVTVIQVSGFYGP
jgi:hypothetical protein